MTLHIRDKKADALARELAQITNETLTEAVTSALEERLQRLKKRARRSRLKQMNDIARHCASLPVLDNRSPDEILGYDEYGMPG